MDEEEKKVHRHLNKLNPKELREILFQMGEDATLKDVGQNKRKLVKAVFDQSKFSDVFDDILTAEEEGEKFTMRGSF